MDRAAEAEACQSSTNMHIDLDFDTLKAELPAGVEPAYDGMILTALSRKGLLR